MDESLARWQAFVAEAAAAKRVNVLDSYLFQNSVRVLLQMDADPGTLAAYQSRVEEMAAVLAPVLIYLDPGDADPPSRPAARPRAPR